MKNIKVAGCDCGKDSLYVCVIEKSPRDFKNFARSYKPKILKVSQSSIDWLLELNADCYAIEPTGSYSYIWIEQLRKHGKDVRIVSPRRVTAYRTYRGVINKKDREDAAAIACYSLENYFNHHEFISLDLLDLKEYFLTLRNTVNNRSPFLNRLSQRLSYECPEVVKTVEECKRTWLEDHPPVILSHIAGDMEAANKGPWSKKRKEKINNTIGRGISYHSQQLAKQLCDLHNMQYQLELKISKLLEDEKFNRYNKVFEKFKFSDGARAGLISAIYPFESFLEDGKERIEFIPSTSKSKKSRTKRNRSEGAFKLSLGMGMVYRESGRHKGWIKGGPKYGRALLWSYVSTIIIMQSGTKTLAGLERDIATLTKNLGTTQSHWLNTELINAIATLTDTSYEVTKLRLHYKFSRPGEITYKRRNCTASLLCRMLYKAMTKEFVVR